MHKTVKFFTFDVLHKYLVIFILQFLGRNKESPVKLTFCLPVYLFEYKLNSIIVFVFNK